MELIDYIIGEVWKIKITNIINYAILRINNSSFKTIIIGLVVFNVFMNQWLGIHYFGFLFSIVYLIQRYCEAQNEDYKFIVDKITNYTITYDSKICSILLLSNKIEKVDLYHIEDKYHFKIERMENHERTGKKLDLYFNDISELQVKLYAFLAIPEKKR